jgi:hypothetical protein
MGSAMNKNEGPACNIGGLGDLTREGGASTFVRLFTSKHVADLRLLFWIVAFFLLVVAPVIIMHSNDKDSLIGSPTLAGGILFIALGAVARIYQMGSVRLGVVDLFSCEMITICRVVAVADAARAFVEAYDNPPPAARKFTSEENYSPIFNSNARDLETLEARVVERVTEFYTYLKTMRDYLRNAADIQYPDKSVDAWKTSMRNTIYMLFLMLESARKAIDQLVEYQPELALYNAEILLSEIIVYGFLWESYRKDALNNPYPNARFERLKLRREEYIPIVDKLNNSIAQHTNDCDPEKEVWDKVAALLSELNRCCCDVFGQPDVVADHKPSAAA